MLSVVVTCHNLCDITRACVERLISGSVKPDEIILVDNNSSDGTQEYFSQLDGIKYIRREINDGSIIGRNVGIMAATGDRILIIDNDQFVGQRTIESYLEIKADVIGAHLCEVDECGIGHELKHYADHNFIYLGIGGLMITREVVERTGILDEGFSPAYCDDPDYFWRLRDAGFSWAWNRDHGILHLGHATLGKIKTLDTDEAYRKSHARLLDKWTERFEIPNGPLVSYVIPTYNRAEFLPECIGSILKQTYKNIEIIVVDDDSTDETESLIKEKYPKIKYLKNETNRRIPYSLNRGFRAARGKYVCWLSDDDGVFPMKTVKQIAFMELHSEIDLSFHEYEIRYKGDADYTGRPGHVARWRPKQFNSNLDEFNHCFGTQTCNANGSTSMFRRSAFREHGYFIEVLYTCQDWEMWLRYLKKNKVATIDENLGWRTEHAGVSQGIAQKDPVALRLFQEEKRFITKYYRMSIDEKRPTICAMLVVKNEDDMIERCLDDLILWVDQIVIVDDGSTDRTPEIIKEYPKVTNIYTQPDKGNMRNESEDRTRLLAMAQATGCDWILFIDADEVFEDRMKPEIYELIHKQGINLWHFKEINFWRSETKYRVDELYDKGWFGRLFRNLPDLKMMLHDEHCGGIPCNIPGAAMWGESATGKRSNIKVKHYGFADYKRTVDRAYRRWVRDPYRIEPSGEKRGGWLFYNRMISETGLELRDYAESL